MCIEPPNFEHPCLKALEGYVCGELSPWEHQRVTDHLLGGCSECGSRLKRAGHGDEVPDAAAAPAMRDEPRPAAIESGSDEACSYEITFDRVFARIGALDRKLRHERSEAPELLATLRPHPMARRMLMLRNSERFHSAGLCELLIEESWTQRFRDTAWTRESAELAVAIAEELNPQRYDLKLVEDLRTRAWAHLGNARRIGTNLGGAEEAFIEAERRWGCGSGSASELARLLDFRAALRSDQGLFEEADVLLDQAVMLYEEEQDHHHLGLVLINKGVVRGHLDDFEGAIELLRCALPFVDHEREPRALVVAVHNLVYFLNHFGRSREALAVLVQWRFLYLESGDRNILLRLHWLEGMIARNLERFDQAEGSLREAQRGFIEQEIGFDAALVSLDLASLYLRQGRHGEVRELVHDMLPIFRSQDVHREAAAALIIFCQAVKRDRVSLSLVSEVSGFLDRAREDPSLHFETDLDL